MSEYVIMVSIFSFFHMFPFSVTGKPSQLFEENNTDWAPSLKLGHSKFTTNVKSSEKREKRRKNRELNRSQNIKSQKQLFPKSPYQSTTEPNEEISATDFVQFEDAHQTKTKISESTGNNGCQTDLTGEDISSMKQELERSTKEICDLKQEVLSKSLTREAFENDEDKVHFYTGLPNFVTLLTIFNLLEPFITVTARSSLDKFQQFLVFLMRLRLNLTCEDLGYRFGVSKSTISRTFLSILDIAYNRLSFLVRWPDREQLWETTPMSFRKHFGTKVAIIIDCFEVFTEKPAALKARAQTFSTYKHHNTVKFLIGISPQGVTSYISKAWGGRVSDKHLTENCGILKNLLPNDIVLADRGFDVQESATLYYAQVKIPAFTRGKKQLSAFEVEDTRQIASVRIHVERVIGLVRRKYKILQSILPTDYLANKDDNGITVIDKIALVCCALCNVCDSVVPFE